MLSRIIDALQTLLNEQAHSALKRSAPEGDAAFAYGHALGVYQGIQMAQDAVLKALHDDEVEDDRGTLRRGGQPYLRT